MHGSETVPPRPSRESALVEFLAPGPPMLSKTDPLVQSPHQAYTGALPARCSCLSSTSTPHLPFKGSYTRSMLTLTSNSVISTSAQTQSSPMFVTLPGRLPQCSEGVGYHTYCLRAGLEALPWQLGFPVGLRALCFLPGASVSLSVQLEGWTR